jgi:hypothetical protein
VPLFGRGGGQFYGDGCPVCQVLLGTPFVQTQPNLRLLVVPPRRELGADPISHVVGNQVVIALCVKTQKSDEMFLVPRHVADGWGVPVPQLWQIALANLETEPMNGQPFDLAPGVQLYVINGMGGFPGAAQVYRLPQLLGSPLSYGALVTFPTNNAFCAVPVRTGEELSLVPYLVSVTRRMADADPMPISPTGVFWYHDYTLVDLEAQITADGSARLRVPAGLREILDHLR